MHRRTVFGHDAKLTRSTHNSQESMLTLHIMFSAPGRMINDFLVVVPEDEATLEGFATNRYVKFLTIQ